MEETTLDKVMDIPEDDTSSMKDDSLTQEEKKMFLKQKEKASVESRKKYIEQVQLNNLRMRAQMLIEAKENTVEWNQKKLEIIRQATAGLEGVSIIQYDNLTIDKCRELGIRHIVRGVRNMIDFETERSIADANRKLAPDIETIIIPTAQEYAHISSTAVRDLLKHGGDTSLFVPEGVEL